MQKAERHFHSHPQWPVLYLPDLIGRSFQLPRVQIERLSLVNLFLFCFADITDDAEDGDTEEFWQSWGWQQAVNTGNCLLFSCLRQAGRVSDCPDISLRLVELYSVAGIKMTIGQHSDLRNSLPYRVSMEEYLSAIIGKTGASASAFACSPALLAKQPSAVIEGLATYGENLGIVIQLVSDVRELWADPIGPDSMNGRLSLPILYALDRCDTEEERELLEASMALKETGQVGQLRERLENLGVRLFVEAKIELFRRKARLALEQISLEASLQKSLEDLLDIPVFSAFIPLI